MGHATWSILYGFACEMKQTRAVPCHLIRNNFTVLWSCCLYLAVQDPTCFPCNDFSAQSLPGSVTKEADCVLLIRIWWAKWTSRISELNSQCWLPNKWTSGLIFENIASNVLYTVNPKWVQHWLQIGPQNKKTFGYLRIEEVLFFTLSIEVLLRLYDRISCVNSV